MNTPAPIMRPPVGEPWEVRTAEVPASPEVLQHLRDTFGTDQFEVRDVEGGMGVRLDWQWRYDARGDYVRDRAGEERTANRIRVAMNTHDDLVLALKEARVELRLLNVTQDGGQQQNTPAASRLRMIDAALLKAGALWPDDVMASHADPHRFKAGPVFQTLQSPVTVAFNLQHAIGPTRALALAQQSKAHHPEYSPGACFYDEVERALERAIVAARGAT